MKKILIADDLEGWQKHNSFAVYEVLGHDITVHTASSGQEGYTKALEHSKEPYDIIFTDMQMETDYAPKMAGEWLIEQIQNIPSYYRSKIIIVSASPRIKHIAEGYNVFYIPKSVAAVSLEAYKDLLLS